jgi:S-DNA-T family DNA segregation ATPase FtsK/SpoIIIE
MGKRGRPKKKKEITIKSEETKIVFGIMVGLTGILFIVSPYLEAGFFNSIQKLFGISSAPLGVTLVLISTSILGMKSKINSVRTKIGLIVLTLFLAGIAHIIIPEEIALTSARIGEGGGMLGYQISTFLVDTFGKFFAFVILLITLAIALSLISGITLTQIKEFIAKRFEKTDQDESEEEAEFDEEELALGGQEYIGVNTQNPEENQGDTDEDADTQDEREELEKSMLEELEGETKSDKDSADAKDDDEEEIKFPDWKFPPINLLKKAEPVKQDPEKHKDKAELIEKTLKSFGIQAKVTDISIGPRVVQYALSITVGTKVSKVKSLGKDLALALATPSGSVRIEAPIPGTSLIGIEIPNEEPQMVTFGEIIRSKQMKEFEGNLPLVFGKDVSGKVIIKDLTKMPHMLIAGATGSGKSVCVNSFLCGLLMTHSPDSLKLILVDPKMVELPPYNGIPHLLTPVITDVEKVAYSLEWLTTEMQKRFKVLNKASVRNVEQYNEKMGYPALPYILLVVDEMADVMLTSGVDVESKIVRLAQMARATGIHLLLATQRPSVDVLTGLIKANVPARIGMNVATTVDSRVILDMAGAENLLGNGDMLFKAPDISRPYRIQGSFVSNEEIESITGFIKKQADKEDVEYKEEILKPQPSEAEIKSGGVSEDPKFPDAVRVVVNAQKASASMLQRKLRVGYNRAARLLDQLHELKVVGPQNGSKPRKVFITDAEQYLEKLSNSEE